MASTYADYDCHGIINSKKLDTHIYYVTTYSTNIIKTRAHHMLDINNGNIGEVHFLRRDTVKEIHFWNDTLHQMDTIFKEIHYPEVVKYNGNYIDVKWYMNNLPGLVMERE